MPNYKIIGEWGGEWQLMGNECACLCVHMSHQLQLQETGRDKNGCWQCWTLFTWPGLPRPVLVWFSSKVGRGPPGGAHRHQGGSQAHFWFGLSLMLSWPLSYPTPNDFSQSVIKTGVSKMCSQAENFKTKTGILNSWLWVVRSDPYPSIAVVITPLVAPSLVLSGARKSEPPGPQRGKQNQHSHWPQTAFNKWHRLVFHQNSHHPSE